MNKKFYVKNTLIGKVVYFNTLNELVNYLSETLLPKATGKTKAEYIQYLAELGHGYDDGSGIVITRALSETFDIGVVKDDTHVRTDVHVADRFTDAGYGD